MANDLAKAQQWRDFILARCPYPAPERLRAQFANAAFSEFCPCGCHSFALAHSQDALPPPLVTTGAGGMVFEADFRLPDEKTLEILLFTGPEGHLTYVEVDCCGNSYPVPDTVEIDEAPFRVYASDKLLG